MPDARFVGAYDRDTPERMDATCGWCRRDVQMERVGQTVLLSRTDYHTMPESVRVGAEYVCPRSECHRPSLLFISFYEEDGEAWAHELYGQLPQGTAQPMEGLPEEIEDVRTEAWGSLYSGNYRSAIVIGRAAVQRAARGLGGEGRDLYAEIEYLREQGVVTEDLKDWAHEVRLAARDAAHPEELGAVTRDEAEASLKWMDAFLEFAVALPARRRADRERARAD